MILNDAEKVNLGSQNVDSVYFGTTIIFGSELTSEEWLVWNYDPFNPLTSDFLTTQIFQ